MVQYTDSLALWVIIRRYCLMCFRIGMRNLMFRTSIRTQTADLQVPRVKRYIRPIWFKIRFERKWQVPSCNLYIHTDFFSKFCLIYWTAPKLARLLDTAPKFALFSVSGLKYEKLIKKQTCMKTETCKLYSRVFWIFLPKKLILIILSCSVSKLLRFFLDTV